MTKIKKTAPKQSVKADKVSSSSQKKDTFEKLAKGMSSVATSFFGINSFFPPKSGELKCLELLKDLEEKEYNYFTQGVKELIGSYPKDQASCFKIATSCILESHEFIHHKK